MSAHVEAAPVRKPIFTPGVYVLLTLMAIGAGFALSRFLFGLKAVTHLDDQYPWGIWIAIDVASGVALAAGGFTTAALAHVFHREHYEVITRPALLTAMLGYTFVVLGLLVDLGRYYNVWHPILPSMWSGHSVLFEVGMCVMFYLTTLYIEFLPIVIERFKGKVNLPHPLSAFNGLFEGLLNLADHTVNRVMFLFLILGIVLSCLHQSSLGTLMVIDPYKMHPLWWTPILPFLFLLSAIAVGFPMVIFESILASRVFGRKPEMEVLAPLSKIVPVLLFVYICFRIGDLSIRGVGHYLWDGSWKSFFYLADFGLGFILPFLMLLSERVRRTPSLLFTASTLVILGVLFNRINVFLIAYQPVYEQKQYIPSIGEIAVTVGLFSGLMFLYRLLVTIFPVLPKEERA